MEKTIRILCLVAAMWISTAVAWSQATVQSKASLEKAQVDKAAFEKQMEQDLRQLSSSNLSSVLNRGTMSSKGHVNVRNVEFTAVKSSARRASNRGEVVDANGVITSPAEGESKFYDRAGYCYYAVSGNLYYGEQEGKTEIVETADGVVYIKDFISHVDAGTWVKGTKSGNTITIPAGQRIYYASTYGYGMYIAKSTYVDDETGWAKVDGDITLTVDGDKISLNGTDADNPVAGFWTDDNMFSGYGDYETVFTYDPTYVAPQLIELPEGAVVETWYQEQTIVGSVGDDDGLTKVAFVGDDVYISGIFKNFPDSWIKGTIDGTTVTFSGLQFLGNYSSYEIYATGSSELGAGSAELQDFKMTYDAAAKTLTSVNTLLANAKKDAVYYLEAYKDIVISKDAPEEAVATTGANVDAVPYTNALTSAELFADFGVIDSNKDGSTWTFDSSYGTSYKWNSANAANDWLISPAIKLEAGKKYHFAIDAKASGASFPEKFEVKLGTEAKASALTQSVLDEVTVTSTAFVTYENFNVSVAATGYYHFGIHATSDADQFRLAVANFLVEAGVEAAAPAAVTDFALAQTEGKLETVVSFKAPTKTVGGDDLADLTKIDILRNGVVIKSLTEGVTPGAELSYVDNDEALTIGTYTYQVIPYNAAGNGEKSEEKSIFLSVALDVPYTFDFAQDLMEMFQVIDDNNDGKTWTWSEANGVFYSYSSDNAGDDYLISMPFNLKAGMSYHVIVNAKGSPSYPERLEVLTGKQPTIEGLNQTVIAPTDVNLGEYADYEGVFTPTEDGQYYIALHAISDADMLNLCVKLLTIEAAADASTYELSGTVTGGTGSVTFTVDGAEVTTAMEGDVVTVTVTGAEGYAATSLTATAGTTLTPEKTKGHIGVWTLTMPAEAVSVAAELEDVWGVSGEADGSADHPYTIGMTLGLDLLAEKVNGGTDYEGKNFKLTADLDYSTAEFQFDKNDDAVYQSNYQAVGGYFGGNKYFKGTFNGDGHTVSGITIVKKGTGNVNAFQGLFGIVGTGGSVSHVTLDASSITGFDHTGGIVGQNYNGTITDCHVTASVSIKAEQGNAWSHGGIVGYNSGYQGGGLVEGCTSAADISGADQGTDNLAFGGIVGESSRGTIKDCIYLGQQVGGNAYVGAIAGYNYNGNVLNCYFTTAGLKGIDDHEQVTSDDAVGSAIGYNTGTATNVGLARTITLEGDVAISGTATDYAENVTAPAMHLTTYTPSGSSDPNALMLATKDGNAKLYSIENTALGLSYSNATGEGYWVEEKATKTEDGSDVTSAVYSNGTLTVPAYDVTFTASGEDVWGVSGDNPNDGTETKPYTISTTKGLDLLAKKVNGGNNYQGKYFVLNNDLDYTDVDNRFDKNSNGEYQSNYQAIGGYFEDDYKYFRGTFNGDGHTVSGITIVKKGTSGGDYFQGLFGWLDEGGSVSHVTLDASSITGFDHTGGIVGQNYNGTITDCHVTADVSIKAEQGGAWYHGGIVGQHASGLVMGCTSAANISGADQGTNNLSFGGIAGYTYMGTIKDCIYLGQQVGGNRYVGAITGYNYISSVLNCYFTTAGLEGIDYGGGVTADDGVGSAIGYNTGTATNVGLARTVIFDEDVAFDGTATDYAATVANPQTAVTGYAPDTDEAGFALTLTTGTTTTIYSVANAEVGIKYEGTLPPGATPTFTVTADSGELVSVTASGSAYSFTMPADNVIVSVMTGTTVEVAAQSWATYCIDQAVTLAGGQTDCGLYTLSVVGTESVTLSEITGTASAGTPLMIWNGSDEPKTVVLNYAAEPATPTEHASEFIGTLADTDVSTVSAPAVYVLYNNSFMRTHTGSIPAHRAYIALTTAGARSLSIGSTTGITAPSAEEPGTVYDMSGRKVNSPTRNGVYIINGKKIVINDKK